MSCGRRRHRRQILYVPHFRRAPRSAPSSRSLPPSMRTSSGPDYRCVAGACGLTSTTAAKAASARYERVPTQRAERSLLPLNKLRRTWGWSSEVSSLAPRQCRSLPSRALRCCGEPRGGRSPALAAGDRPGRSSSSWPSVPWKAAVSSPPQVAAHPPLRCHSRRPAQQHKSKIVRELCQHA